MLGLPAFYGFVLCLGKRKGCEAMNTADFYLSLDIHESSAQVLLRVKKGDTARKLVISLTENGKPYEISRDCKAVFTARKPDGHLLYNACTVQGNRIIYALTAQTAAVAGEVRCELRLYGADSALITSPRFLLLVDDTVYSDGDLVESSAEFSELTQMVNKVETLKTEIEEALKNGDFKGETGETSLPIARADSADGIAYTATDAGFGSALPTVAVADSDEQVAAVGKGRQLVLIPWTKNQSEVPTLRLNGGEVIPIRLRAPQNQSANDTSPDATLPVPVGALMRGVPYTLTFCGKYWLIDSLPYSGRVDKTTDYAAWTPAGGTWKLVDEYAKMLPDGKYYIFADGYASCFVDVFTSYGNMQWRVIREYTDEFFFIKVYCGNCLLLDADTETVDVMINGKRMLTDYNIPLPTQYDIGKVLVAYSENRAAWTAVTNAEEAAV